MSLEALQTARDAHRRLLAAEARAKAAKADRDAAVIAAFQAGLKPPTIHDATGVGLPMIRKILRTAGLVGSAAQGTDEEV